MMIDYKREPDTSVYSLVSLFELLAMGGLVVGLAATFVAGFFLLENGRSNMSAVSLIALICGLAASEIWWGVVAFLTVFSLIQWPTGLRWVNWPLLIGGGVCLFFLIGSVVISNPYC